MHTPNMISVPMLAILLTFSLEPCQATMDLMGMSPMRKTPISIFGRWLLSYLLQYGEKAVTYLIGVEESMGDQLDFKYAFKQPFCFSPFSISSSSPLQIYQVPFQSSETWIRLFLLGPCSEGLGLDIFALLSKLHTVHIHALFKNAISICYCVLSSFEFINISYKKLFHRILAKFHEGTEIICNPLSSFTWWFLYCFPW